MVEYKGVDTEVLIICNRTKEVFEQTPYKHINIKHGCRCCKRSKGEIEIKRILDLLNIEYNTQKRFDDCRNSKPLPFDFYLLLYNILIEYQGEQHFKSIEVFGGDERFEYQKINDEIKRKYCLENNIELMLITYLDLNNIEEIIKNKISSIKE